MRTPIEEEPKTTDLSEIEALAEDYINSKADADAAAAVCDSYKKDLKQKMAENNLSCVDTSVGSVKISEAHKKELDTAKLLEVAKQYGLNGVIETVEVVNLEKLENYLYHNTPCQELARALDACYTEKIVESLRISKKGGK